MHHDANAQRGPNEIIAHAEQQSVGMMAGQNAKAENLGGGSDLVTNTYLFLQLKSATDFETCRSYFDSELIRY